MELREKNYLVFHKAGWPVLTAMYIKTDVLVLQVVRITIVIIIIIIRVRRYIIFETMNERMFEYISVCYSKCYFSNARQQLHQRDEKNKSKVRNV